MVKEIILIILLFNGELKLPSVPFEGTVHECFKYGNTQREAAATYVFEVFIPPEGNRNINTWLMNDGSGTWQGFICG